MNCIFVQLDKKVIERPRRDVVESEVAMFLGDFLFVALAVPGSSSLARYLPRQMVTMKQLSQLLSLQIME